MINKKQHLRLLAAILTIACLISSTQSTALYSVGKLTVLEHA